MPTLSEIQKILQKGFTTTTDSELLEALKVERELFTQSREVVMEVMINELIRRKVYTKSTPEGNPNNIYDMVKGWGAYWHVWKGTLECPHCKADLRDHNAGPPFIRQIGKAGQDQDRITKWQCPDCNGTWERV